MSAMATHARLEYPMTSAPSTWTRFPTPGPSVAHVGTVASTAHEKKARKPCTTRKMDWKYWVDLMTRMKFVSMNLPPRKPQHVVEGAGAYVRACQSAPDRERSGVRQGACARVRAPGCVRQGACARA